MILLHNQFKFSLPKQHKKIVKKAIFEYRIFQITAIQNNINEKIDKTVQSKIFDTAKTVSYRCRIHKVSTHSATNE